MLCYEKLFKSRMNQAGSAKPPQLLFWSTLIFLNTKECAVTVAVVVLAVSERLDVTMQSNAIDIHGLRSRCSMRSDVAKGDDTIGMTQRRRPSLKVLKGRTPANDASYMEKTRTHVMKLLGGGSRCGGWSQGTLCTFSSSPVSLFGSSRLKE